MERQFSYIIYFWIPTCRTGIVKVTSVLFLCGISTANIPQPLSQLMTPVTHRLQVGHFYVNGSLNGTTPLSAQYWGRQQIHLKYPLLVLRLHWPFWRRANTHFAYIALVCWIYFLFGFRWVPRYVGKSFWDEVIKRNSSKYTNLPLQFMLSFATCDDLHRDWITTAYGYLLDTDDINNRLQISMVFTFNYSSSALFSFATD